MKKFLFVLLLVPLLGACEYLKSDNVRVVVGDTFVAYTKLYQPLLIQYSKLPTCDDPAKPPCKDPKLYSKLYWADAAAVTCMRATQLSLASESPNVEEITTCISTVEKAKFQFVGTNIKVDTSQ